MEARDFAPRQSVRQLGWHSQLTRRRFPLQSHDEATDPINGSDDAHRARRALHAMANQVDEVVKSSVGRVIASAEALDSMRGAYLTLEGL